MIEPQRVPFVWPFIAGVIVLMAAGAISSIIRPAGVVGEQLEIHQLSRAGEQDAGSPLGAPDKDSLRRSIAQFEALNLSEPAAKGTVARALLVLRKTVDPTKEPDFAGLTDEFAKKDALTPMAESSEDIARANEAIRALVGEGSLSAAERAKHLTTLSGLGARWPLDILERSRVEVTDIGDSQALSIVAIFGTLMLGGTGCLMWLIITPGRNRLPMDSTPVTGDQLGVRFLLFLGVLMFAGPVISGLLPESGASMVITTAIMAVLMVALLGVMIGGRRFGAGEIGLRSENLRKDIAYGVAAFFANIPALVILLVIGMTFMTWIPSGGHPVEAEVFSGANLWLLVLSVGPLTAFVEEVAFRGMLFQGLAMRIRLWPAIVLSSLAFAVVHPQGGALWLALAWIGGMGAYLTYKSGSLVPAIVMHAIHNSAIIIVATQFAAP